MQLHRSLTTSALTLLAIVSAGSCSAAPGDRANPSGPPVPASSEFWTRWGDGRAELAAYDVTVMRYGAPRAGRAVLIWVTEPMDARTWIKDDRGTVPPEHRVNVLKLNHTLSFRTGIYPYSVMTSAFSPVDGLFPERFAPAKISFTAQEWCGHVYQALEIERGRFHDEIDSYFQSEGERARTVKTAPGTLYEDALWIQLRELDGPFHGGEDWSGDLVPTLWSSRKAHAEIAAVPATIRREEAERDGAPVTRFVLEAGSVTKTIDVERALPHRLLGWETSEGERGAVLGSARLPYWQLNAPGDESWLGEIGLGDR